MKEFRSIVKIDNHCGAKAYVLLDERSCDELEQVLRNARLAWKQKD